MKKVTNIVIISSVFGIATAAAVVSSGYIRKGIISDYKAKEAAVVRNVTEVEEPQIVEVMLTDEEFECSEIEPFDENGVYIMRVSGRSFQAHVMVVNDPSKVFVGSIYPWKGKGLTLDKLVEKNVAIGGINGGLYANSANSGGSPLGFVVQEGKITYNAPSYPGIYLIGFNDEDKLIVENMTGLGSKGVKKYIEDNHIRDAVAFLEDKSDPNCHFVNIIENGEARDLKGIGVGLNPRTVIGQREDGAVLLVTVDGRGTCSHLGANASELQELMLSLGAVTAANLDGGSSSAMYYDGAYEMNSVTFYYRNSSWNLPTAFLVKGEGGNGDE